MEFDDDWFHDRDRHATIPKSRCESSRKLFDMDWKFHDDNNTGDGRRFRHGGIVRTGDEALRSGSRIVGCRGAILVSSDTRIIAVLSLQGTGEVPPESESIISRCMDRPVRQWPECAIQLVVDIRGTVGINGGAVGNVVHATRGIRINVHLHAIQQAHDACRYVADFRYEEYAPFGITSVLEHGHIRRVGLRGRGVVLRGNDDIVGPIGHDPARRAHHHAHVLDLCLSELSVRGIHIRVDQGRAAHRRCEAE